MTAKVYFSRDFQKMPWQRWDDGDRYWLNVRERAALRAAVLAAADLGRSDEQAIEFQGHRVPFHVLSPVWIQVGLMRCLRSQIFAPSLDHAWCRRLGDCKD